MRKSFVIASLLMSIFFYSQAQNRSYLPYSIFGIGDINARGFSRNLGMGQTGIGLSSGLYLNNMNPASYSDLDSISFFFDVGLSGNLVKYQTNYAIQHGRDINVHNLAMGFRATRFWTSGIGIIPYSTIGYRIEAIKNVEGNADNYSAVLQGTGGLNQLYWDNSFLFFKHLSVGIKACYLFGNVTSTETVAYNLFSYNIITTKDSRLDKLFLDVGLQYLLPLNQNKWRVVLGGIFGTNHQLNFKDQITISQTNSVVYEDKTTETGTFTLPAYYGMGFSVEHAGKLVISGDYRYDAWSLVNAANLNYDYVSCSSFGVGAEYCPGPLNEHGYIGRLKYRIGYYHEGSYIRLNGTSIANNGVSLGIGIPFLKNKTSVNLSYDTGVRGTMKNNLIRERYHSFMLSLTLHDWWFVKAKYD